MDKKTNYVRRLALLKSEKPRLVIRRALDNVHVQIIVAEDSDKTLIDVSSSALRKYGWKGHGGSLPAAYLTGYLAGMMALRQKLKEANVDIGLQVSKASSLYAAAAGAKDAGLAVPIGKESIPGKDRLSGKHIADYALKLKGTDKYQKQFSATLKAGMAPEEMPKHFEETKAKIAT